DFRKQSDRYSIQRALQYLEDLGGIQLVDGQTKEWVEQTPDADVLYEFTDVIRSLIVALRPYLLERVAERLNTPATALQPTLLPEMAEAHEVSAATGGNATTALMRAWCVLLLGPALFRFDDPAAFTALTTHAE